MIISKWQNRVNNHIPHYSLRDPTSFSSQIFSYYMVCACFYCALVKGCHIQPHHSCEVELPPLGAWGLFAGECQQWHCRSVLGRANLPPVEGLLPPMSRQTACLPRLAQVDRTVYKLCPKLERYWNDGSQVMHIKASVDIYTKEVLVVYKLQTSVDQKFILERAFICIACSLTCSVHSFTDISFIMLLYEENVLWAEGDLFHYLWTKFEARLSGTMVCRSKYCNDCTCQWASEILEGGFS